MSRNIQSYFAERFANAVEQGGQSTYFGVRLAEASREELLAVISELGEDRKRQNQTFKDLMSFSRQARA